MKVHLELTRAPAPMQNTKKERYPETSISVYLPLKQSTGTYHIYPTAVPVERGLSAGIVHAPPPPPPP